jgi:hypothetical protein
MCPEDLVATSQKEIVNVLQNPDSLSWSIDDSLLPKRVAPASLSVRSPAVQLEEKEQPQQESSIVWIVVCIVVLMVLSVVFEINLFDFFL